MMRSNILAPSRTIGSPALSGEQTTIKQPQGFSFLINNLTFRSNTVHRAGIADKAKSNGNLEVCIIEPLQHPQINKQNKSCWNGQSNETINEYVRTHL